MDNFGSGGGSETSAESLARFHRAGLGYQCPGRNSALPSSGKNPKCYRFLRRAGTTAHITKRPAKATIPRIASSGNGVPPVSHRQAGGTAITAAAPPNHPPRPTSIVAMISSRDLGNSQLDDVNVVVHDFQIKMQSFDKLHDGTELGIEATRVVRDTHDADAGVAR